MRRIQFLDLDHSLVPISNPITITMADKGNELRQERQMLASLEYLN